MAGPKDIREWLIFPAIILFRIAAAGKAMAKDRKLGISTEKQDPTAKDEAVIEGLEKQLKMREEESGS